ncbi:hypothetical protein ACFPRL_10215 [Pseudoclavibacter helvolus]
MAFVRATDGISLTTATAVAAGATATAGAASSVSIVTDLTSGAFSRTLGSRHGERIPRHGERRAEPGCFDTSANHSEPCRIGISSSRTPVPDVRFQLRSSHPRRRFLASRE